MSILTLAAVPHSRAIIIKQQTIGTSSAALTAPSAADVLANTDIKGYAPNTVPRPENIFVQAAPGNSGTITLMPVNPAVSLGAGIILSAGMNTNLPLKDASKWYIIGSAASQVLNISYQYGIE